MRVGTIANLINLSIPRKDTVKVTLSNGNEIVVTKDFPLIGAGKAIGWQVYDAIAYKDKEVSFEVLEVGKELYSWPIKVSEYEHITELEEQIGEELEEMYAEYLKDIKTKTLKSDYTKALDAGIISGLVGLLGNQYKKWAYGTEQGSFGKSEYPRYSAGNLYGQNDEYWEQLKAKLD